MSYAIVLHQNASYWRNQVANIVHAEQSLEDAAKQVVDSKRSILLNAHLEKELNTYLANTTSCSNIIPVETDNIAAKCNQTSVNDLERLVSDMGNLIGQSICGRPSMEPKDMDYMNVNHCNIGSNIKVSF